MYCGHVCNNIKWERYQFNFYNLTYQNIELLAKDIQNSFSTGVGLNLGHYINVPLVYKEYLDELRSKVFVFKEEYSNNAKVNLIQCVDHVIFEVLKFSLNIEIVVEFWIFVFFFIVSWKKWDLNSSIRVICTCFRSHFFSW